VSNDPAPPCPECRGTLAYRDSRKRILRLQLIVPMPVFFNRKVERGCLLHDGGVLAKFGITPVHIAVLTSETAFGAAVPWIPERHGCLLSTTMYLWLRYPSAKWVLHRLVA